MIKDLNTIGQSGRTGKKVQREISKSRFRSRVEHIFGFMEISMNGMYLNSIGIRRATAIIGLVNLTYNMFRKIQLPPVAV
ncbi:MAG: hypothetical protein LBQ70_05715 [Prevotellaceae bacterium]|nr:hypothetical protein [Prevotellaceae bacterium]